MYLLDRILGSMALCAAAFGCSGGDAAVAATSSGGGHGGGAGGHGGGGALTCADGRVGLFGSLGSDAVDVSAAWMQSSFRQTLFQSFFQTRGRVVLFAADELIEGGGELGATGLFRMPVEAPSAGQWFCAGAGSSVSRGADEHRFRLASLSTLGGCPGTPVAGTVSACLGGGLELCPQGTHLTSSLEGAAFDWSASIEGWGGALGLYEVRLDNGAVLTLDLDLDAVLGGLLLMPADGPDPGAAYCFGGGSLEPGAQNGIRFTLSGLSRLGSCAEASPLDGQLDGCIR
jgi:hypothetical protein